MTRGIDLNCDLAEGVGNEVLLMPWISSANIACGYHAGNEDLMKSTVELCLLHGVSIGAHPSFPDRKNFGRTAMTLPFEEVIDLVSRQILVLQKITNEFGTRMHHVKPHGALYNMAARGPLLADSICKAICQVDANLILFGLSGSAMIAAADRAKLKSASEVFADRTYQPDASLTPRTQANALIADDRLCAAQAILLARQGHVADVNGDLLLLKADTLCLHGDGLHADVAAKAIKLALTENGIAIRPPHA